MPTKEHLIKMFDLIFKKIHLKGYYVCVESSDDGFCIWPEYGGRFNFRNYELVKDLIESIMYDLDGEMEDSWPDPHAYNIVVPLDITNENIKESLKDFMESFDNYILRRRLKRLKEKRLKVSKRVISTFNL